MLWDGQMVVGHDLNLSLAIYVFHLIGVPDLGVSTFVPLLEVLLLFRVTDPPQFRIKCA